LPRLGLEDGDGLNGKSSASRLGRILATSGAALVGYLGLGPTLWQISPSIMLQIVYIETTVLAGLAVLALYQAALVARLDRAKFDMALRFSDAEYISNLTQGIFSLVVDLLDEPRVDSAHQFRRITEDFFLQGNDGTFNWTFDGTCSAPARTRWYSRYPVTVPATFSLWTFP
jgi:hypothetical protein